MTKLCICKICECGRHRCAHQRAKETIPTDPKTGHNFTSEMKQSFKPAGPQGRVIPRKPVHNLMNATGPMQKTTTSAEDYPPKSAPVQLVRPKRCYNTPTTKMYDKTTYRKDYCPEDASWPAREPPAGGKPNNLNIPDEKMESKTTQIRDYVPWNRKDAEACRGKLITEGRAGTLTLKGQEFSGQSETNRCYQKPEAIAREKGKRKPDHLRTEGKFEGKTTTTTDYTVKELERKVKGIGRKQALKWPDDYRKTVTTYKTDYKAYKSPSRTQPCGPRECELKPIATEFQGHTSYKMDFPAHLTTPRFDPPWKPCKKYERPDVVVESETTYRKDYPCHEEIVPEKGKGREHNLKMSGEPMAIDTTHRLDFGPQAGFEPSQSTKKIEVFTPPTTKFTDETVTRRDYTGEAGDRCTPIKHEGNLKIGGSPMDMTTMTRKDYQCIQRPCPAALLRLGDKTTTDQYKFIEADHGHEYYEKLRKKSLAEA